MAALIISWRNGSIAKPAGSGENNGENLAKLAKIGISVMAASSASQL